MRAADARVVLVTTPDVESARRIARALVEERQAACGNIVPGVTSIFRWQGAVQEQAEALLVLKTSAERMSGLSSRIAELHPYDVPEVLALPVDQGSGSYLEWLGACLAPGGEDDESQA